MKIFLYKYFYLYILEIEFSGLEVFLSLLKAFKLYLLQFLS